MCFIFKLSKYVSIPILTEWFDRRDLIMLNVSLVNCKSRDSFSTLMKEYSYLLLSSVCADQEVSLLELCGWSRIFSLPTEVLLKVSICKFDLIRVKEFNWLETCVDVLNRVRDVVVAFDKDDTVSDEFVSCITNITSITIMSLIDISNICSRCNLLTSVVLNAGFRSTDQSAIVSMCRSCPMLESLTFNCCVDTYSRICHSITVHCKKLKRIKSLPGDRTTRRNAFIFAFHSVSSDLTDIDWEVYDDKDSLVLRTRLWYKGGTLTHLNVHYNRIRSHIQSKTNIISSTCTSLCFLKLRFVTLVTDEFDVIIDSLGQYIQDIMFVETSGHLVVSACMKCPVLRVLQLNSEVTLANSELLTILQCCPLLTSLLLDCDGLNNGYLTLIAPHIRNVSVLRLPYYMNITSEDCAVLQNMKKLHTFEGKFHPSQPHIMCGLLNIPALTSLNVKVCSETNGSSVYLGASLSEVRTSSLTLLELGAEMDDNDFITLMSYCPHLTYLRVYDNRCLTVKGVRAISSHCKKLRKLNLLCTYLKWNELDSLKDVFPRLVNL